MPTKVSIVKVAIFPAVMDGCEIWTIKKAGCFQLALKGAGKDLESSGQKEVTLINPKGKQP